MARERITLEVEETTLTNERGYEQDSIIARCPQCGHEVKCYGQTEKSHKRACAVMAEECPEDSNAWYTTELLEENR